MALAQLLLEQGLYKTIPKISLASSNWSSPLSAVKLTLVHSFILNLACLSPHPVPKWEKLPQCFSEHCYNPYKCKEHTKCCFSNTISMSYQEFFISPLYLEDAFIHTSKENSCSRPQKYLMCSMLSCTSLSTRSFKLFLVTIHQC